jgi:RNA polymerase-interacting CarD/CdnL/TRCF family regulator
MMTEVGKKQVYTYNPGDWIVHRNYGIGQIKAIEPQSIGEQETTYYKIEAHNDSTIWVPVASKEELLRPVASKDEFAEVVQVMKRPSRRMNAHFPARIASIRQVSREGNPVMLARVVRDLWARRSRRGQLSTTEEDYWRQMTERLIAEWTVSMGLPNETQAHHKMYTLLKQHALVVASQPV